jgi:hypothetical protein
MRRGGNEDKREVFLWSFLLRFRGRGNNSIPSLGKAPHLSRTLPRVSSRFRIYLDNRILGRLRGNWLRLTGEEVRPLGGRVSKRKDLFTIVYRLLEFYENRFSPFSVFARTHENRDSNGAGSRRIKDFAGTHEL